MRLANPPSWTISIKPGVSSFSSVVRKRRGGNSVHFVDGGARSQVFAHRVLERAMGIEPSSDSPDVIEIASDK